MTSPIGEEWSGLPASDGNATGVVVWVESASDLESFPPRAIMLARMTSPDWGGGYQRAAAIATVEGGMLCHAAQVAREEGIPAVVGVGEDLVRLRNGDLVEVDGDEGTIRLKREKDNNDL